MSDAAAQQPTTDEPAKGQGLAEPWGAVSRTVDLDGEVHYIEWAGPKGASPVLLVHGLGGNHLNWVLLGQRLAQHYRVYALDLVGFGLTRATERSASVGNNAKLVRRFLDEVVEEDAILVGNSMGGLISTMVTSRVPDRVRGLVLLAPALAAPKSRPQDALRSVATLVSARKRSIDASEGRAHNILTYSSNRIPHLTPYLDGKSTNRVILGSRTRDSHRNGASGPYQYVSCTSISRSTLGTLFNPQNGSHTPSH